MKAKLFYPSPKVPRPTNTSAARVLLPVLLITFALLLASSVADAHGSGYYQIRGAHVDPYVIHVWVAPGVLRTGVVHIDTAVFDQSGKPALDVLVRVAFVPLESESLPMISLAGAPNPEYPHARGATFSLATPGMYRLEVAVSDAAGKSGVASDEVAVTTIGWPIKIAIGLIFLGSAAAGAWLIFQTRAFWMGRVMVRQAKLRHLRVHSSTQRSFVRGEAVYMSHSDGIRQHGRISTFSQRLNSIYHAPALWFYMLVIVAHWLEHVLQIYQIYALGWEPSKAGGILGVIYPQLIESETLHFVYDFIQWAGIIVLLPGFREPRARLFWTVAMVIQTWHYIEHVLLMGQYLTKYYLFGAPHQISILQLWFPRAELHFTYNLLVFVPMVIAVHYYLQPKLAMLAAMKTEPSGEES